jgi:hypothetical protein
MTGPQGAHHCASGKAGHSSIERTRIAARSFAIHLNQTGELSFDMFGYRCPDCHHWHITHRDEWDGRPNLLVFEAPPESLQRWAITGEPLTPAGG